jgi:NADH dehydrogenase
MRAGAARTSQGGTTRVEGDLLQPETYRKALGSCHVVVHLAAAMGRASAEEHRRVNAEGTAILVEECKAAGVANLLFVSSIATTFTDQADYHYAKTKALAEATVSGSGLRFTIVRPAMILGPGAAIQRALESLALLPVIPMPGTGQVRVQPIHVDDVVDCLSAIVETGLFDGETFELGGPDVITMEELLQRIRRSHTGRTGRVWHVPLGLLRPPLRVAEAMGLGRLLPLTAGQLASFRCDGVAAGHLRDARLPARRVPLSQMVPEPSAQSALAAQARQECRVFTRHLLQREPDDYVIARYTSALATVITLSPHGRFDRWLLSVAGAGGWWTSMADSYAGLFCRRAALRKRLVILLAILETRPPFHHAIDRAEPSLLRVAAYTTRWILSLTAGTLILVPARLACAVLPKGAR